jgi:hypothetical protein
VDSPISVWLEVTLPDPSRGLAEGDPLLHKLVPPWPHDECARVLEEMAIFMKAGAVEIACCTAFLAFSGKST